MTLTGNLLIGQRSVTGNQPSIRAVDPTTNQPLEPAYPGASGEHVAEACALAWAVFDSYRETPLEQRATFLETIASEIEALGDTLIDRAVAESGLPKARIQGERGRTCTQLRTFARVVRDGEWLDVRVDNAQPERQPLPRADLRQRQVALGPVAVFGASNFPLAFSVAGGDTAWPMARTRAPANWSAGPWPVPCNAAAWRKGYFRSSMALAPRSARHWSVTHGSRP